MISNQETKLRTSTTKLRATRTSTTFIQNEKTKKREVHIEPRRGKGQAFFPLFVKRPYRGTYRRGNKSCLPYMLLRESSPEAHMCTLESYIVVLPYLYVASLV